MVTKNLRSHYLERGNPYFSKSSEVMVSDEHSVGPTYPLPKCKSNNISTTKKIKKCFVGHNNTKNMYLSSAPAGSCLNYRLYVSQYVMKIHFSKKI